MQELKYLGNCLLDTIIAICTTLFCKIEVPELDENTEAFYHK